MSVFVTADTHFYHEKVIITEDRPFVDVDIMNRVLIYNWNQIVKHNDTVIVAGDFSFGSKEHTKFICDQLHGNKILIMGNHDKGRGIRWWMDVGFNEVSKYPILYKDFILIQHEPPKHISPEYIYFYAHVHNNMAYKTINENTACVCSSRWGYGPVNVDSVLNIMNEMKNKK